MALNNVELIEGLSSERLKPYKTALGCHTMEEIVKAHHLLSDVSQHFYVPVQVLEISLRNRVNHVVAKWSNSATWYDTIPVSQQAASAVIDAKTSAQREISGRAIIPDDIISRLSLGFWVYMFDTPYRDSKNPSKHVWDQFRFKNAFPALPPGVSISIVMDKLKNINQIRNRLFHHEPIWKSGRVKSLDDALNVLKNKNQELHELIKWLSPEQSAILNAFSFPGRFLLASDSSRFDRSLW